MSTRRAQPGGWVTRKRGSCRRCGAEVPQGRFTFCSDACVHEWRLRTDPAYLREQVFRRDRGVCALCGLNTQLLPKPKGRRKRTGGRRHLWEADHILPVAEGGGECDLSNMRTLCRACHRAVTAELRARLRPATKKPRPLAKEPPSAPALCALCGLDTEALRREKRKLDWAARRQFEKEWGAGRQLWQTVGGRTLCLKCLRAAGAPTGTQ